MPALRRRKARCIFSVDDYTEARGCFSYIKLFVRDEFSQRKITGERHGKADEPRVIVKLREKRRNIAGVEPFYIHEKSGQDWQRAKRQGNQSHEAEAIGETILTIGLVKRSDVQFSSAINEIVCDQNSANRSKQ